MQEVPTCLHNVFTMTMLHTGISWKQALTGSKIMILSIQLSITPWIMKVVPCKLGMAAKAFLLKWK